LTPLKAEIPVLRSPAMEPMERAMKLRLIALAAIMAAAAGLSACAYYDGYYGYYGPPVAYADMDYQVYYDGYYGPFYGGYWGPAGRFYYWDHGHSRYHRDAGGHFSRETMPGFNAYHGRSPSAQGRSHARPPGGSRSPH
jgi:hypothetical protein